MADTQVNRLRKMMGDLPQTVQRFVYIAPVKLKKSEIRHLEAGDLWVLPQRKIDIIVEDKNGRILAEGEYGTYHGSISILINHVHAHSPKLLDSNKYKFCLGSFVKRDLARGEIVPLKLEDDHSVHLCKSRRILAYATLSEVKGRAAVKIEEIR
jgi:hypothetical protein